MSSGFYNKCTGYHNRRSIRLRGYDYSRPGYYFVTICTHDRRHDLFGGVENGDMVKNGFGIFAEQCWREIPEHFPHARLDEFVVMPNHVHGIIWIVDTGNAGVHTVGANDYSPLRCNATHAINPYRPHGTSKTIGSIVRGFKIGVTKLVRQKLPDIIVWQRNFYEHIIRDEKSLYFIRKYIRENPAKWAFDRENHINREIREFEMTETGCVK